MDNHKNESRYFGHNDQAENYHTEKNCHCNCEKCRCNDKSCKECHCNCDCKDCRCTESTNPCCE